MTSIRQTIKGKWELQKGQKYTRLLLKGKQFQQWPNKVIASVLKSSDFDKQVEWFKTNLADKVG